MQPRSLPGGLSASPLGFGCGAVMGRVGRKQSLRAMHAAVDAGVTLFDTARSYGYGESEAVLGEFLQGRRGQLLVSTKFGVEPAQRQRWKQMLRPAAQAVLRRMPSARQAIRRTAGPPAPVSEITVQGLQASLDLSLRQLRTDYVDFLFLHDVPPSTVAQEDIFAALAQLRDAGKLRWFGVSSSLETAMAAQQRLPALAVATQMPVNLKNLSRANDVARQVLVDAQQILLANNIFGGADGARASADSLRNLVHDVHLSENLRDKLAALQGPVGGQGVAASQGMAEVMLPIVLRKVGVHVAIVSMMSPSRVLANVEAVDRDPFTDEELEQLYVRLTGAS